MKITNAPSPLLFVFSLLLFGFLNSCESKLGKPICPAEDPSCLCRDTLYLFDNKENFIVNTRKCTERVFLDTPDDKISEDLDFVKSCPCNKELRLFEYPAIHPESRVAADDEAMEDEGKNWLFKLPEPIILNDSESPAQLTDAHLVDYDPSKLPDSGTPGGDRSSVVALIDSGIDIDHQKLTPVIWVDEVGSCGSSRGDRGYNVVTDSAPTADLIGHGTFIAGILAYDIPPDVDLKIMNVQVFDEAKSTSLFNVLCGMYYAIDHGADIINLSLGLYVSDHSQYHGALQLLQKAIDDAHAANIVVVTSSGNKGLDNDDAWHFPSNFAANNANMLAVAAADKTLLADYSNYGGNTVSIAAPGGIISTFLSSSFAYAEGTSMAAGLISRSASHLKALSQLHPPDSTIPVSASDIVACINNASIQLSFDLITKGCYDESEGKMNCLVPGATQHLYPVICQ